MGAAFRLLSFLDVSKNHWPIVSAQGISSPLPPPHESASLWQTGTWVGTESAYELLKALVREHPDYAEAQALHAHVTLWNSARMGGKIPWIIAENQIRRALQKASSLNPALPEIYLVEGRLHTRSGDPESAIEFFERAIELNPSYAEACRYLSQAAADLGRTSQAWEALEMARKLDPISVSTLRWVIRQARENDRPEMADDAMQVLRQVAPAGAGDLEYRLLLSDYRLAEAAIALEDIRANWPNEDPHDYGLSFLYAVLGQRRGPCAANPDAGGRLRGSAPSSDRRREERKANDRIHQHQGELFRAEASPRICHLRSPHPGLPQGAASTL
jgi:tetratricopeptide (TPR) repeat protein